jgi:hypothetical protein
VNAYASWVARWASWRRFWVLLVLEVVVLGAENVLDFPLSVPFMRRVTGYPYLDMCAFCSPAEIREQLDAFGPTGRSLQLWLMPTVDVVIPLTSWALGTVGLALMVGVRSSWSRALLLVPIAALALDLSENAAIVGLVLAYPARLDSLARAAGLLTGTKFVAYGAGVISLLTAAALFQQKRGSSQANFLTR